jgi:multidrug efflux pump subunit AcrB
VLIFGSQKYAVRIQIDPSRCRARHRRRRIAGSRSRPTNANTPVGTLQNNNQQLTIQATRSSPTPRSSPMSSSPPQWQARCGWATSPRSSIPSRTR